MSMGSGFGAAAAARDIQATIDKLLEEYAASPDAVAALVRVKERCEDIAEAGDSGWY
jgi:hypothetical protein